MSQSHGSERGIVIYDSRFGNTEKIARSLAGGLRMAGLDTVCINTNDVQTESLQDYEFIAIGAPTQMFTASRSMKDFLLKLGGVHGLRGKYAFAFDTKFARRLSGSASKYIEKTLKDLGMKIVRPRQSAIVDKTEGPLAGGEVEAFERIGFDIGTSLTREGKTLTTATGGITMAQTQGGVGTGMTAITQARYGARLRPSLPLSSAWSPGSCSFCSTRSTGQDVTISSKTSS